MPSSAYWAYGLAILADFDCPEFLPNPAGIEKPDVTIHLMPPSPESARTVGNNLYEVQTGNFRLTIPGVALYRVEEGCRIFIEPYPEVPVEKIRLYLLGSVFGALLYQRGLFPLHGSAIETPWGAMVFVGAQGAGKSTLVAEFHRKGYRLLSDDVCAVAQAPDGLQILPALAQFRLCADAFERMGAPQIARFDVDKFVVPLGDRYCPRPVLLRAIHVLRDQDPSNTRSEALPAFQTLRGLDRVQRLLENLYRPQFLKGQETQRELMRMAGLVAQKATIAAVTRQRVPEDVKGLAGFLETVWSARFTPIISEERI